YDMHSSLPQQLDNFRFHKLPMLRHIFRAWEIKALRKAEAVITVCPTLLELARKEGAPADRSFLIENSIVDPVEVQVDEPTRRAEGIRAAAARRWVEERKPDPTVIYAGTLEPYQGIDRLLEAFVEVLRALPEAALVIAGGLPRQVEHYRHMAAKLGLGERVMFAGWLSPSDARDLSRRCAAAVSPRETGDNTPMKIYELIAHAVPLVATRINSHTQVLNDDVCTLTGISPGEMAAGILQVLANPALATEKAGRAAAWYGEHYSRRGYASKLRRVLSLVAS
ncbi:MAG TPA: glycosyltransferase, partial [Steroidobacteraceae bacterium]|nr:glycosyltransferase [Steroidobacteraceae bacterium]